MNIRQIADLRNKLAAARSPAPFKEGRDSQELANTSAIARGQAAMNTKIAKPATTVPLSELVKKVK